MTWLALADRSVRRFSTHGLGIDRQSAPQCETTTSHAMPTGTLLIEAAIPGSHRPVLLFGFEKTDYPAHRFLAVRAMPGGGLACIIGFGDVVHHMALDINTVTTSDPLLISFSWDARRRWARLTVERPGTADFVMREITLEEPFFGTDFHDAFSTPSPLPPDVEFMALSSNVEPVGPTPGLTPDTCIDTPYGDKPVTSLRRGDLVYTANGDLVPVLHTIRRRVPARGMFRPIRLRAPYFGLQSDVVLSASQKMLLQGIEVQYTHGCEAVLIPVNCLLNGRVALEDLRGPVIDYVQIVLPTHDAVLIAGGTFETQFVGRLRRHKDKLAASLMSNLLRRDMPEHIRPCAPVLDEMAALFLEQYRFA